MSAFTLEEIKARQAELAAMIAQLSAAPAATKLLVVQETEIELKPGEHYAGQVLDENGELLHHLVLMAEQPSEALSWDAAMKWAESVGGSLPTRQEQALLFANCKPHIKPEWHWSSEVFGLNASYAWYCYFLDGTQYYGRKLNEGSARAVRRLDS